MAASRHPPAFIGWLEADPQFPKRTRIEAGLFTAGGFQPLRLALGTPDPASAYAF